MKTLMIAGVAAACFGAVAYAAAPVRRTAAPASRALALRTQYNPFLLKRVPVTPPAPARPAARPAAPAPVAVVPAPRPAAPAAAVVLATPAPTPTVVSISGSPVRPPYRPATRSPYQPPTRGPYIP
jgi:hypothetical protein